ncbi:hypothetical protein [Streptomyces sp. SAI-127]|uniref:hypothetical protein n=1 Tax=Streptomyces sp. SAI-127 TaxID=2940543 RepID=UPI002475E482|nr:hypothetical protein [Streptomyces sp. SAI-127]MDH6489649.1 hypothetical protein [Streptomyces sp. SAI-127]
MDREEVTAELLAALRPGPTPPHVTLETADGGTELLFYGDDPAFTPGGVMLIPAAVMDTDPI